MRYLRDTSNTNRVLREVLGQIADQLGQKRISVTQDTYFGRKQAPREVTAILDVIRKKSG